MDNNDFLDLISKVNKIYPNINNINELLTDFSKSYDELELKKINDELIEIKKILDTNNMNFKKQSYITENSLLDSINEKFNYLKNISDSSKEEDDTN